MTLGRINSRARFIDCQLLLLIVIGAVASYGLDPDASTSSAPGGVLHETVTSFAIGKTTMLHVSTTGPTSLPAESPQSTVETPPHVTSVGASSAVTHIRVEVQQPPSTITEVTTGATSGQATSALIHQPEVDMAEGSGRSEMMAPTARPEAPTISTNANEATNSPRPETVSSTNRPEVTSSSNKAEVVLHSTIQDIIPLLVRSEVIPFLVRSEVETSSKSPEVTSSSERPEVVSPSTGPEVKAPSAITEMPVASTEPKVVGSTDSFRTRSSSLESEVTTTTSQQEAHERTITVSATQPDHNARTTTTATEAETRTTSVVSSAPSPGTISSSSEFATAQHQHPSNLSTTNDSSPSSSAATPIAIAAPLADFAEVGLETKEVHRPTEQSEITVLPTTAVVTGKPLTGASRRRIVALGKNDEPKLPFTTTITTTTSSSSSSYAPPILIEDDVLNIEEMPTVAADLQPFSIIEIGSGIVSKPSREEDDGNSPSVQSVSIDDKRKSNVPLEPETEDDRVYVTAESNDVSDESTSKMALWFVLVLEGNCSLIARGRQGQGERGFKNQVLEHAAQWLGVSSPNEDVSVTDFHCSSPDRIRANLTVLQRPSGNVSSRLAALEESREPFMRYHGQDFFVYQIVTADGYLNKEPELPPVVDLQHSNVELVIYIASGSTCAFLLLLAVVLLAYRYWGRGGTQKPFDFAAVNSVPAPDQLTNMRLEDYTLTRIPRPRIGHVQDYYYRGLHTKRNYAPLTDVPSRSDKAAAATTPGGGMVRASDTSVVPLEDDSIPASGFRDGVIVRPMDIRQSGQQQHYRQLLGGSLGRLYRGARRSAGRTSGSKLSTVVDADGFRVRSTENLHSMSAVRPGAHVGVGVPEEEEEERCVVDRGVDNPNFQ